MPLVIFTGLPSSGKSKWARKLVQELQTRIDQARKSASPGANYSIIYHSDELLGITTESYRESTQEKHSRGTQMSAVKRDILRTCIVVLDSMAYIKGFRYQLYCEAKGVITPHCVIQVAAPVEKCLEWNNNREDLDRKWAPELINQIAMRYEEPNDATRWDSPLFTVISDYDQEELAIDQIWNALVLKQAPPPNAATIVKATSGNDFLQELDLRTASVLLKVAAHQQMYPIGGEVLIDKTVEPNLMLEMPATHVSIAQLQRIRRTFISLNRMRNIDVDRIIPLFTEYVERSLESGN